MKAYDVVVLGAGAAGLMCAIQAGRRGRRVAVLEHNAQVGRKILISGGGRCNFTNAGASPAQFVSENPAFCASALARFTPDDFLQMVQDHRIPYHEKTLGQLFCDRSAQDIVAMLLEECRRARVEIVLNCRVEAVERGGMSFVTRASTGAYASPSLVVATGGLSIPKIGASDLGYRIARQFGLRLVEPAPALDGFVFQERDRKPFEALAGVSIDAIVTCGGQSFREHVLWTHGGLSGPAALQASLHWRPGADVRVDCLPSFPGPALLQALTEQRALGNRAQLKTVLSQRLPKSFAEAFCRLYFPSDLPVCQLSNTALQAIAQRLHAWTFVPVSTVGYGRAEVTRGGVDTRDLSSKTMAARAVPGLYFIGEVVDVTGWLGGYNFQWAWASGWAAGQHA